MTGPLWDPKTKAEEIAFKIFDTINGEFSHATDRAVAVVGAAYIDNVIDHLLRKVLGISESDKGTVLHPGQAIGDLGIKCQVCRHLNLINDRQATELNLIRKIRNEFAHKFEVDSFDHISISKHCSKLAIPVFITNHRSSEPADTYSLRERYRLAIFQQFFSLMKRYDAVRPSHEIEWYVAPFDDDSWPVQIG